MHLEIKINCLNLAQISEILSYIKRHSIIYSERDKLLTRRKLSTKIVPQLPKLTHVIQLKSCKQIFKLINKTNRQ